jgi:gliding motility-associated protein GldC
MTKSTISIDVHLDESRVPELITWNATDTTVQNAQKAKGMMLSFWDSADKTALRIDLWTKDMMVDEMADFFYQTIFTMADTYGRATNHHALTEEMKAFARAFYEKAKEQQMNDSKA